MMKKLSECWLSKLCLAISKRIIKTLYDFMILKGGLISECLSLLLIFPKMGAKSLPWALFT